MCNEMKYRNNYVNVAYFKSTVRLHGMQFLHYYCMFRREISFLAVVSFGHHTIVPEIRSLLWSKYVSD